MPRASESMRLPPRNGGAIPLASSGSTGNMQLRRGASSSSTNTSSMLGRSTNAAAGGGDRAAAGWTPLREDYFEAPLLSQKEKSYLVRKACEAALELVERARSADGPISWRHVDKADEVQLYAGQPRGASGSSGSLSMCGVMSVPGSVKEVAALFDLSTTAQAKAFAARNGPQSLFYDAVVLHTLEPRSREKPLHQVTAKWMAVKMPRGLEDRDFCYLECQDKFIDSLGRKGWVLCMHSIKLPGCDDLQREFGLVRGSVYHSGLIVVEAEQRQGYVDVIHVLQMSLKKGAATPPAFLRDRVLTVGRIRVMMRAKRLNEQRYLSDLELVPKKYRSRCTVCQDSFSLLLLRKLNCRKCGEVVCGACSKEFTIDSARIRADAAVKLRICMRCYQLVTAAPQSAEVVLETPRASTSLSFLEYCDDVQRASFITQGSVNNDRFDPHRRPTQQQQHRPTKIFLQSMRRPSSASSSALYPSQSVGNYRPDGPSRSSMDHARSLDVAPPFHRGASSRQSMSATFQYPQSSSRTVTMGYQQHQPPARPPPSPASIFDRPMPNGTTQRRQNNNSAVSTSSRLAAGGGSRMNTPSESRSRLQELASQELKLSAQAAYAVPRVSYDFPSSPLGMDALRTTEASLANPPSPVAPSPPRQSPMPAPMRRAMPEPQVQRDRASSDSSDSSTGSIDIDSYEDGSSQPGVPVSKSPATVEEASPVRKSSSASSSVDGHRSASDAASNGDRQRSGKGSDPYDPSMAFKANNVPPRASPSPRQYHSARDDGEETKAEAYSTTQALPPPSPSAYATTKEMLERQSTADSACYQGGKQHEWDGAVAYGGEEDFIDREHDSDSGSEEGDVDGDFVSDEAHQAAAVVRASATGPSKVQRTAAEEAMILNTAGCDMRYLDEDMRQFHDQSLFVTPSEHPNPSYQGSVYQSDGAMSSGGGGSYNYLHDAPTSPTRTRDRVFRERSAFYGKPPQQAGGSTRSSAASASASASAASNRRPPRPITPVSNRNVGSANPRPSVKWAPSPTSSPRDSYRQQQRTPRQPETAAYFNPSTVSTTPTEMRFAVNGSLVSTADARQLREAEQDLSYRRSDVRRTSAGGSDSGSSAHSHSEAMSPPAVSPVAQLHEVDGSFMEASSRHEPPSYLPSRFHSPSNTSARSHAMPSSESVDSDSDYAARTADPRGDGTGEVASRFDAVTLGGSPPSFETNEAKNVEREPVERADIQHTQFLAPREGSVLDAVPETVPHHQPPPPQQFPGNSTAPATASSASSNDDSDSDDDQLLSARVLYKSFGDTGKLASLVGNASNDPRFQRRFSQLQRNMQRASDGSSDEDE